MRNVAVRYRPNISNGRKADPVAARKIAEEAFAYKHKHGGMFKGMTRDEIIAQVKKTRYELFEERFAPTRSR